MKFALIDYERSLVLDPNGTFKKQFWSAMNDGLQRLGHTTELLALEEWNGNREQEAVPGAQVYVFWNGHTGANKRLRQHVTGQGHAAICAEHGWFHRWDYFYLSINGGIAANAHFTNELGTLPVSEAMIGRMIEIIGHDVEALHSSNEGHVVIAHQMKSHWSCKVVEVLTNIDPDRPVHVRCHPNHPPDKFAALQRATAINPNVKIYASKHGTAYEDLKTASCVITRNSGIVHEGMLQGLPCIASNKVLSQQAPDIVLRCDPELQSLAEVYTRTQQGWRPDEEQTRKYFARLCSRQWSADEIRNGHVLANALDELERLDAQ